MSWLNLFKKQKKQPKFRIVKNELGSYFVEENWGYLGWSTYFSEEFSTLNEAELYIQDKINNELEQKKYWNRKVVMEIS